MYSGWNKEDLYSALPAFCYLLNRLKAASPDSKIVCILGTSVSDSIKEGYKTACAYYGVDAIPLSDVEVQSGHPTIKGMTRIKDQIISYLAK